LAKRILAAVALGLIVVVYVVLQLAGGADVKYTVVAGPPDPVIPTVIHSKPTRYAVVPTPIRGRGRLYLQVGTYLKQPTDTIVLDVLDGRGSRIARCVFSPSSYTDNGKLRCPISDISRVRGLVVIRRGTAKVALYGHDEKAGYLVKDEATSLPGRISTALSRIAVPLPNGWGSTVLLLGLFGSVSLTALALLLVVPLPSRRRERE
jgi:hypothetical protein